MVIEFLPQSRPNLIKECPLTTKFCKGHTKLIAPTKKQLNLLKTYIYKIIYNDEFTKKAVVRKIFPSTACIFCVLS